jgi:hypothetical protein
MPQDSDRKKYSRRFGVILEQEARRATRVDAVGGDMLIIKTTQRVQDEMYAEICTLRDERKAT